MKRARGGDDGGVGIRVKVVLAALEDDGLPSEASMAARRMLARGGRHALPLAIEERHPVQDEVCGMIREFFDDAQQRLSTRVEESQGAIDTAQKDLEDRSAELAGAEADLGLAQGAVEEQSAKCAQHKEAVHEAEAAVREVRRGQKSLVKEHMSVEKERHKYEVIQEELLRPFADGMLLTSEESSSAAEGQKILKKLVKELEKCGADAAQLAAAPPALLKKPEERTDFDGKVVDSLQSLIGGKLDAAETDLATNSAATTAAEEEASAKVAIVEKAKAEQEAEDVRLAEAQVARDTKADAKKAAQQAEDKARTLVEGCRDAKAALQAGLAAHEEVRQNFEALASRSSAPPPPVPEELVPVPQFLAEPVAEDSAAQEADAAARAAHE